MKITAIDTFAVSNGFNPPRPWLFCAGRTDSGLTGYSEFGSDGITRGLLGLVQDLGHRLIGKDPTAPDRHALDLYRAMRQTPYGATQQAIAGIELACWDIAGKALGVPVYKLFGGPHLSTFQSLNLCASVSNVTIMESDPEQTPFRDELFTALPEIHDGHMAIPTSPGWGTELNETAARTHAWTG